MGPSIAQFHEHRSALGEHLLLVKLRHWERQLRELASQALGALVASNVPYFQEAALQLLLPLATHTSLEVWPIRDTSL